MKNIGCEYCRPEENENMNPEKDIHESGTFLNHVEGSWWNVFIQSDDNEFYFEPYHFNYCPNCGRKMAGE